MELVLTLTPAIVFTFIALWLNHVTDTMQQPDNTNRHQPATPDNARRPRANDGEA